MKKDKIISLIFIIMISFMTVGYAYYGKILNTSGNILVNKVGMLEITNVTLLSSDGLNSSSTPTFSLKETNFQLTFTGSSPYQAVYQIELTNNSEKTYIFSGINYSETITSNNNNEATLDISVDNISNGEIISPGDVKVFNVTLDLSVSSSDTYNVMVSIECGVTEDLSGSLIASINNKSLDVRNGLSESSKMILTVISTYSYSRSFSLSLSNSNFLLVDENDNIIENFMIEANATKEYTIYVKPLNEAIFLYEEEHAILLLNSNDMSTLNVDTLDILVLVTEEEDTVIPTVGNANLEITSTVGSFKANWNRIDTGGSSIVSYTIILYNENGEIVNTINTNSDLEYYEFTNMEENSYYFIVYGTDAAGNTGEAFVSSATENEGYATKSSTLSMKWTFSVDTSGLNNMTASGDESATIYSSYQTTLSANRNFRLPSSITVTMNGETLVSGTDYTYTRSNGVLIINNVTGDIKISGNANFNICLVEGTKIMLYDGSYKNIEDINYDDLLMVYSYETGNFVYEYPIWIEKTQKTDNYQLTTFSDGTTLKTVGFHGIFSVNDNMFISVDDENFKIGTKVLKINEEKNGFKEVFVTKIETIYEEVNYYHVVSTRYYNIIANDLLTTDGTVILSNLYGFNKDLTWTNIRDAFMSDPNNLYKYDEFEDIIPYYMFKGLRMEEGKYLNTLGLSKEEFREYLKNNQVNEDMLKETIKNNSINMWMVTTSDDLINDSNKKDYLLEEGSIYTLKEPKVKEKFLAWYNMSDGKYYKIGDQIKVETGIHFEAIYK